MVFVVARPFSFEFGCSFLNLLRWLSHYRCCQAILLCAWVQLLGSATLIVTLSLSLVFIRIAIVFRMAMSAHSWAVLVGCIALVVEVARGAGDAGDTANVWYVGAYIASFIAIAGARL